MIVRVISSLSGYWYSSLVGSHFGVCKVNAYVAGHVHSLEVYEVCNFGEEHDGDYILLGDAEVVQ